EVVAVDADASVLNSSSFDVGGRLDQRSMENMPITSRNTFNLALLAPGFNGRRDDEFGNPKFAFGGMQRRAFLIDGIDNLRNACIVGVLNKTVNPSHQSIEVALSTKNSNSQ